MGADDDVRKWQQVTEQVEQPVGVRPGVLIPFIYLRTLLE